MAVLEKQAGRGGWVKSVRESELVFHYRQVTRARIQNMEGMVQEEPAMLG